jgi:hypothetical protein
LNKNEGHRTELELPHSKDGRHALVLGGSLAGLLAARVLSDYFERVTVIERDASPTAAEARRGTPQANHVHALMPRGRLILEQLFPGLENEMMADGAPLLDMAKDIAWLTPQGWGVNFHSHLNVLSFTRPLLDLHVRRRLCTNPRIRIMQDTDIVRLAPGTGGEIAGAVVRVRANDGDAILATSEDYRYRETEGGSANRKTRFMHRYVDHALKLSTHDPIIRHVLLKAFGMLVPPTALFHPRVSLQVIRKFLTTTRRPERQVHSSSSGRMVYDTAD